MRAGRATGVTGEADLLSSFDGVALRDARALEVEVERADAAAVRDHDDVAGEERVDHERDGAIVDRGDLGALARREIEAEVLRAMAVVEGAPLAEHRRRGAGWPLKRV